VTQQDRVLHVLEAAGGGTLRHVLDILRTVHSVEHHVVLPLDASLVKHNSTSAKDAPIHAIEASGATVHRLNMVRFPLAPANYAGIVRLRTLTTRLQPIVLHGHSSMGGAFVRLAALGRTVPVIYTPNGLATNKSILAVERALAPLTDRFVAVSESEGHLALKLHLTTKARMVVINNAIDATPPDPGDYDLRQELSLAPGTLVVGTVARLVEQKAPADFVRMCEVIHRTRPDIHFVLVGSGELQPQVETAIATAQLGSVFHQITYLPNASAAIAQFDVFALNSQFEGGPYTPMEAMRAGVPVVLTDVAGSTDTVEDGISGLKFAFGDFAGMADGVVQLLNDQPRRDAMVAAALERFMAKFDVTRMGALHERLYAEMSSSRPSRIKRR
jgi:glycosyltransferase involved in cell wall biosynthesis